ncbi:uncharacterized protein PFL1_05504 [Pseudozyma flocculosa PF-1]|uniref:Phosphoglycerate mutase family protein n=2 Tax=Pseudozyma flocculosa TaxID=84751 RepID=A0A5C3FAU8_9BASI|nr:uncharacterized protein PFL1_05504 [Pseudozyma flocculosa PF-1]EPQ26869.1 hypothetical protein PFL1_05504 [Pseudozyma flocculosa PF-1]SPO41226.1 uncharacterized protein PSFLO_06708 [Pseudozyma flocculosa]
MTKPSILVVTLALLLVGVASTAPTTGGSGQGSRVLATEPRSPRSSHQQVFAWISGGPDDATDGADERQGSTNHFDLVNLDAPSSPSDADGRSALRAGDVQRQGQIFLIRHGEKVKHDKTGLSPKGKQRAKCIKRKFSKGQRKVDFIITQSFLENGRRKRPFWTVEPLARKLGVSIHHGCDRDDAACAARIALRQARQGQNVLISWEHKRLTDIGKALGVRGIEYPEDRFDVLYTLQLRRDGLKGGPLKLSDVVSEQCSGLDRKYRKWKPGKHKGGGLGKDAVWPDALDDEDEADSVDEAD